MKSQLDTQKKVNLISVTGVKVTQNAIIISDEATDSALLEVGQLLSTVEKASNWWLGDYCIAMQKRRGDAYGAKQICATLGLRVGEGNFAEQAAGTARFFPPESRVYDVSWSHYYEAKNTKDLKAACDLLEEAQENGWKTSDVRKAVRLQKATAPELENAGLQIDGTVDEGTDGDRIQDPGPVRIGLSDLYAADRWAADLLEDGFDPDQDEIKTLLGRTKNLRKLLKQLENSEAIDV